MNSDTSITFIKVMNNTAKLQRLSDIVHDTFMKSKKCIIFTDTPNAAKYIDDYLWKFPQDSFIPHVIANQKTDERVVITNEMANLNQAEVAINLTAEALSNLECGIQEIFELYDLTSQEKENISKQKLASYTSRNVPLKPLS